FLEIYLTGRWRTLHAHGAPQSSHSTSMSRSASEGPPAGGIVAPGPLLLRSMASDQWRISGTLSKLISAGACWRISAGKPALWQLRHQLAMNGAPKLS